MSDDFDPVDIPDDIDGKEKELDDEMEEDELDLDEEEVDEDDDLIEGFGKEPETL